MMIEPIFSDDYWKDLLIDLRNIGINNSLHNASNYEFIGSTINPYGNKVEVIIPSYKKTDKTIHEERYFRQVYIPILELIINKHELRNHIFRASFKFSDICPYTNKKKYWTVLKKMGLCSLRIYTILENHYLQRPLLQTDSVRMNKSSSYPLSLSINLPLTNDMANSYKYIRK